jgi:hypothetical protein
MGRIVGSHCVGMDGAFEFGSVGGVRVIDPFCSRIRFREYPFFVRQYL